ncbi:MAG: DUF2950 domain-containing protein [Phycisphaerales bacterium]
MLYSFSTQRVRLAGILVCGVCGLAASLPVSCSTTQETAVEQGEAFATPQALVDAAVAALRSDNQAALAKILGADAYEDFSSGDDVQDRANLQTFLAKYDQSHRLVDNPNGSKTLEIGPDNWPMAFPIIHDGEGWRFDTAAGIEELNARRIGRNELDCIETCRAVSDAQADYLMMDPDGQMPPAYAQTFFSNPGTKSGLFWPTNAGETPSPMGDFAARASAEGYTRGEGPQPYHGYFFRLLREQGPFAPGGSESYMENGRMTRGFAVIAYPAEYDGSGVMSFMIAKQGIVYQRDLGPDSASIAKSMTVFNPDPSWTMVK